MKKFLIAAACFTGAGLLAGVCYREIIKGLGLLGQMTSLSSVHGHFLGLGMLGMLVIGLVTMFTKAKGKLNTIGYIFYLVGVAGTGGLLFARGMLQAVALATGGEIIVGADHCISWSAGLMHGAIAAGLVLFFISWFMNFKKAENA